MGAISVSGSYSSSNVKGDYASVNEQTAIQAGDGGFQLEVQGHSAVIVSSDKAVEDNLNRLETGTLAVRDIDNHSDYKASAANVALGYCSGLIQMDTSMRDNIPRLA